MKRLLSVGIERERRQALRTALRHADKIVGLMVATKRTIAAQLAVGTVLQRKGRTLDAMRLGIAAIPPDVIAANKALFDEFRGVNARLAQLALSPPQELSPARLLEMRKRLSVRAEALEREISRKSASFRRERREISVAMVAKRVPAGSVLLGLYRYYSFDPTSAGSRKWGQPRYLGYSLDRAGAIGWADLGEASRIDAAVEAYRKALITRSDEVVTKGKALYDLVIAPLATHLDAAKTLIISPDGALNLVPFAALVGPDGKYLIERYGVRYVTSGRDLLDDEAPPSKSPPLLLADIDFAQAKARAPGDDGPEAGGLAGMHVGPLPGTRIEAEGIKKALGLADDRVLLGARATEAAIKAVHGPRILHVATHGFFLPDQERFAPDAKITPLDLRRLGNPLVRSGLALAGFNARGGADGADDGVLTALEVTGLDLTGTELVVLSACETGLGRVDHGEGVYGLKRALVLAGARTQAVTLWKVSDDATQALMNAYYARLLKGEDRIEAMRAVQLDMLGGRVSRTEVAATTAGKQRDVLAFEELGSERGHNWKHPFYWASFTVSGAEGPIEMASADPPR